MVTIKQTYSYEYKIRSSVFIGNLFQVSNESEFDHIYKSLKNRFPKANHHCCAYRINPDAIKEYMNDDREPPGTAGQPILNRLRNTSLVNCGLIIVRYFGGTKLGKSGLSDAYSLTAEKCIQKAETYSLKKFSIYTIRFSYSLMGEIEKLINKYGIRELESEYLESVTLKIGCPAEYAGSFKKEAESISHLFDLWRQEGVAYLANPTS